MTASFPLLDDLGRCPVCSSRALRPLHLYRNRRLRVSRAPQLVITGCRRCGIVYTHPLPTEAELASFYSRADGWDARDVGAEEPAEAEEFERGLEENRQRYRRKLNLLRTYLAPPRAAEPAVLDFGCGRGEWLDALADAGWRTYGIEPAPRASRIAARRHEMLSDIPPRRGFDLVIANHVLEHLRDPASALKRLAAALHPGGQLFVSTPDLDRLPKHRDFNYASSDVHIFSFTYRAMCSLLARSGLAVQEHLRGLEWDESAPGERSRLRVLARRPRHGSAFKAATYAITASVLPARGLVPAERALRRYGAKLERKEERKRAAASGDLPDGPGRIDKAVQ